MNTSDTDGMTEAQKRVDDIKEQIDENLRLTSKVPYITTPDTEWEKQFDDMFQYFPTIGGIGPKELANDIKTQVRKLLSSRDTYWKERVAEARVEAYNKVCLVRGNIRDPQLFIDTEMFVEALTPITNEDNLK